MINFIKGFIIGIGKIIPGVSGAILATSMGVYDKAIFYICNLKKDIKNSIKYLLPLSLGIIISIILFSKVIDFLLNKYYAITMLFFVGLILGGIPSILEKIDKKNYYISIISCIIFSIITISNIDNNYILKNNFIDYIVYFISGVIETIGTIVPGVSATALLMIMGTYNTIIYSIGNIKNIKILISFTIGIIVSLILFIKLVDYLLKKYNSKMHALIFGLLLSSIFLLVVQIFNTKVNIINLVIGIIFMLIGIIISNIFK